MDRFKKEEEAEKVFTEELRNKIDSYIEENREAVISFLEELVNLEGRHGEKEHLLRTAAFLKRNFDEIGMETVLIEVGEANAPIVTGVFNKDAAEKEIVFTGHYDTVFAAAGAGGKAVSYQRWESIRAGGRDMKGGIAIAFFTVKALQEFGFRNAPGTAVLCRR